MDYNLRFAEETNLNTLLLEYLFDILELYLVGITLDNDCFEALGAMKRTAGIGKPKTARA